MPDLLLIDGGPGQLDEAIAVLNGTGIEGDSRRRRRKGSRPPAGAGAPVLRRAGAAAHTRRRLAGAASDPARSATKRTASPSPGIAQRRAQGAANSLLETVPGLGPRKRRELLRHFGGLQGVARAGVEDLAKVHGIGRQAGADDLRHVACDRMTSRIIGA